MNIGCLFQPEVPYYLQRKVRAQNWIALSAALLMPVLVPGFESVLFCVVATCSVRATLQRSFPTLVYA